MSSGGREGKRYFEILMLEGGCHPLDVGREHAGLDVYWDGLQVVGGRKSLSIGLRVEEPVVS